MRPAGLLDDAADWEALEPHQVPAALERLHGALEGCAVQTLADLDAAATAAESAASRSQAAERIIDLQQKARTATSRLAELETAGALRLVDAGKPSLLLRLLGDGDTRLARLPGAVHDLLEDFLGVELAHDLARAGVDQVVGLPCLPAPP